MHGDYIYNLDLFDEPKGMKNNKYQKLYFFMKKLVICIILFALITPFIQAKESKIKFGEFKEYVKSLPGGEILIKNMEKFGLEEENEGFIIKFLAGMITQGNGYAFPTTLRFSFFSILPVVWYYLDGSTEFYTLAGKEVYGGSYVGGAIVYPIGLWIAPRLLQQPGNIFGIGIVVVAAIFYK